MLIHHKFSEIKGICYNIKEVLMYFLLRGEIHDFNTSMGKTVLASGLQWYILKRSCRHCPRHYHIVLLENVDTLNVKVDVPFDWKHFIPLLHVYIYNIVFIFILILKMTAGLKTTTKKKQAHSFHD